jgi:hypothetical protein
MNRHKIGEKQKKESKDIEESPLQKKNTNKDIYGGLKDQNTNINTN